MRVIYPPQNIATTFQKNYQIFLAGSIEMGKAVDWQQAFIDFTDANLSERQKEDVVIYNPRRKDWNSEWKQGIEEPQFYQQVSWELDALASASHIIMYLEPGTISPISLLELGLYAESGKLLVVCPEGYHRKGNVDIVCVKYGVNQFKTLVEANNFILDHIHSTSR